MDKNKEKFNFNKALEELKKITAEFDNGNLDLDQALIQFKKGLVLAQKCKERLREVENEVIKIKAKFGEIENGKSEESPAEEQRTDENSGL